MAAVNEIAVVALGSAVIVKVLDIFYDIYKTKTKKKVDVEALLIEVRELQGGVSANNAASKAILKDRLKFLGRRYITEGKVELEDFEAYSEMYRAYSGLNGNGFIEEIYYEVCELEKI